MRVVDPALGAGDPVWGDGQDGWQPPALEWIGTLAAAGVPFRAGPDAATDDGEGLLLLPDPDAVDVVPTPGRPLLTGSPPDGAPARLAAVRDALGALAVPDMRGLMVLRLDDPGAAVKRYLASWSHPDVSPAAWASLWQTLGEGRVSVFCCPGWVDEAGEVVASRRASPAEWEALDDGVRRGRADLECHGYTHMDPRRAEWRDAPDRAESAHWYREMWPPGLPVEPPVGAQQEIVRRWQEACGPGTTLVAPGEAWGLNTIEAARRQGLSLFNSWGICRLDRPVPTWSVGVGSPYLDGADGAWLAGGLPVVGYWHDRDMAIHGPGWAPAQLAAWRDCGVQRFVAFADLARAYATEVDAVLARREVEVRRAPAGWPLRIELAA